VKGNWQVSEKEENPVTKPLMTQYLRVRDAVKMSTTRNGIKLGLWSDEICPVSF